MSNEDQEPSEDSDEGYILARAKRLLEILKQAIEDKDYDRLEDIIG
jgi:hypothetical protein